MADARASMGRVHLWLSAQSLVLVLASANRLSNLTTGYVSANEFLRWVDLLNLLVFPLASTLVLWLLWRELRHNPSRVGGTSRMALELGFIAGLYLLAASYGTHEVTNYINTRFCFNGRSGVDASIGPVAVKMCGIIAFNDDEFSHWVFFTGFSLVNAALMLHPGGPSLRGEDGHPRPRAARAQRWVHRTRDPRQPRIRGDRARPRVVVGLTLVAFALLWRAGRQPLHVYYAIAYGVGLVATVAIRAASG
ncbi:MAG: hypothetical protein U0360_03355 [Dehalococcoidia bacterium]